MGKKFDATTKYLVDGHVNDWLTLAGLPLGTSARVIESDVSTVSAVADKMIRVEGPSPYIAHLEFQASLDINLDSRMLGYNVVERMKTRLPVWSVVFLLRPQAYGPKVTGRVYDVPAAGAADALLDFRYKLVRVWEQPVELFLDGGIGTLPLAPIAKVREQDVPEVIRKVRQRLSETVAPPEASDLLAAMSNMMGLRYNRQKLVRLLQGVTGMEESSFYQMVLEKGMERGLEAGRVDEVRAMLIRAGSRQLGSPSPAVLSVLQSVMNRASLEAMTDRLFDRSVASWDELLGS